MTKKILIIAGSDSCGGAGLQTDIKTASAHKVYSSAVVTCLTAQNTAGVYAIHNAPIPFLKKQLEVVLDDIKFEYERMKKQRDVDKSIKFQRKILSRSAVCWIE